jgi:single-stranded DNA-binding protein
MSRGIEAATWANATRDAEVRTSKAGSEFAIINAVVHDGTTDDQGRQSGTFVKILCFSQQHVATARGIKRGDRVYAEGQFSASIWRTNDGEARLDLSIRAFKFEKTAIGKNRSPRGDGNVTYQTPIDQPRPQHEFEDEVPF